MPSRATHAPERLMHPSRALSAITVLAFRFHSTRAIIGGGGGGGGLGGLGGGGFGGFTIRLPSNLRRRLPRSCGVGLRKNG